MATFRIFTLNMQLSKDEAGEKQGTSWGECVNTVGEKKKVTRRKVGQLGGDDYECTVDGEASVGEGKSSKKTTSGRGGPGLAPLAKTNNSPDLRREEKPVDARVKEIGGDEEGDKRM